MAADQQYKLLPLVRRLRRASSRDVTALCALAAALVAGAVSAQAVRPAPPPAAHAAPSAAAAPVPAPAPAPLKLDTVAVQRGEIQETVEATGKLQLHRWADAYAQIGGQVKDVTVAIGDSVKADQVLVEIAPSQQPTKLESTRAQMARLQADLADQRAQAEFAQLQFQRQTQLKAQNATRQEAFESARMSAASASARVDAITAQIHELEATSKIDEDARQQTHVKAPIGGTVVSLAVRPGQMVSAAQPAAPLLRIADLSDMTVAARVAEKDVTRLRPGMAASFTTPGYPGKRWSGKLRQVIPVPADGSGEQGKEAFYTVLFEVKNPDHELMSGMSTQVQFVAAQARDALLLPANVLGAPDEDGMVEVNVVEAGPRVSARKVKLGMRSGRQVQILSGLGADDKVLVGPVPKALAAASRPSAAPGS
jgi:macrolide-specific efflux system membrane fusion protein